MFGQLIVHFYAYLLPLKMASSGLSWMTILEILNMKETLLDWTKAQLIRCLFPTGATQICFQEAHNKTRSFFFYLLFLVFRTGLLLHIAISYSHNFLAWFFPGRLELRFQNAALIRKYGICNPNVNRKLAFTSSFRKIQPTANHWFA